MSTGNFIIKRDPFLTRQSPFTLIFTSIFLVMLISTLGFFQATNHFFYEAFPNVFSEGSPTNVVTVVVNNKTWQNDKKLNILIKKLNAFSPKDLLIFQEYPDQFPNIEKSHDNIKIVPIAHKKVINAQLIELELEEGFDQTQHIGAAIPPPIEDGIIRMSTLEFTTHTGETVKSFLHEFSTTPLTSTFFSINFDKVTPFLVEVTSDQILQNKSIKQIFENKIVILGHSTFAEQAILRTPFRHTGLGFSLLQFHALSLEAVLNEAELSSFSVINQLLLIITSLLLILYVMQKLSIHSNLFLLNFIIIGGTLSLNVMSHAIESILPVGEFIVTSLLSYWIYFHTLQNRMAAEATKLSSTIKNELSSTTKQLSFNEAEKPWLEITSLVQQYLLLNKTIFLEKIPKDHRVKEIQALNCSLSDIKEMRRDYEREPYNNAIKENAPIEISRPYFEKIDEGELEFIVPLLFADEVLGFWAMTIKPDSTWDKNQFIQNVHSFSEQISYLLYHRQAFQQGNKKQTNLQKGLSFLAPKRNDNKLKFNVHSSLKKLSLYQNIFNTMHSSAIIYDLFGRVIEANNTMEIIAERCNLNVFNLNALDLLHKITQLERNEIRKQLKNLILNQQTINFTTTSQLDKHTYMVSVTPVIENKDKSDELLETNNPFSVIGLLVEFVDVGSMQQLMTVERKINSLYLNDVYSSLSTVQLCKIELERLTKDPEVSRILSTIQRQLDSISACTKNTQQVLNKIAVPNENNLLPVDLLNIYRSSKKQLEASLATKNIQVTFDSPKIETMVYANQHKLITMLKLMMSILIDDAQLDSTIRVIGKQKIISGKKVYFISMSNEGFGIPKETLINISQSKSNDDINGDVMKLKQIINNAHHWHAQPRIFSKLGKGIRFSLILSGV